MSLAEARYNERALALMGLDGGLDGGDGRRLDGAGVSIGVVDYGFDLLHPTLLAVDGRRTRFSSVWNQAAGGADSDATLGRADIDRLIETARASGSREAADARYDPHANYYGRHGATGGAHGTLMASIAAGSPHRGFRGAAPGADLIGVHLALPDHAWKEEDANWRPTWTDADCAADGIWSGWRSYDASPRIVEGLRHVHAQACARRSRALVVNLSIGTWAGAHDGRSPVEAEITELIDAGRRGAGPAVAVVVGAGNAGADRGHYTGEARAGAPAAFDWLIPARDTAQRKLEIWYDGATPLRVRLMPPRQTDGAAAAAVEIEPDRTTRIVIAGRTVGIADHVVRARGRLSRVRLLVNAPAFPRRLATDARGRHAFGLALDVGASRSGAGTPARINAWAERDLAAREPATLSPGTEQGTLCAFACARGAIAVAGLDHHAPGDGAFPPSSLGPLPWGRKDALPAPLVAAPAHRIWGAQSKTGGLTPTSGTSAAAALVSGLVAVLMQRALAERGQVCGDGIAAALAAGAGTTGVQSRSAAAWSPRHGFGIARMSHTSEERVHDRACAS